MAYKDSVRCSEPSQREGGSEAESKCPHALHRLSFPGGMSFHWSLLKTIRKVVEKTSHHKTPVGKSSKFHLLRIEERLRSYLRTVTPKISGSQWSVTLSLIMCTWSCNWRPGWIYGVCTPEQGTRPTHTVGQNHLASNSEGD